MRHFDLKSQDKFSTSKGWIQRFLRKGFNKSFSYFMKSPYIEDIEWTETTAQTMAYRFPVKNRQIKMGARLTVKDSQAAVFVHEGNIADVFPPGHYQLSTENLPALTMRNGWKYGFHSLFKAEVYFVNTKPFTDQKWSTANPIMLQDAEYGMLRLHAFGAFSFRVANAEKFMKEVFATNQIYDTEYRVGQFRSALVSGMSDLLKESKIAAVDLAKYYNKLSEQSVSGMQRRFDALGLQLTSFVIDHISFPEEVEKALDKKFSMELLGNPPQASVQSAQQAGSDVLVKCIKCEKEIAEGSSKYCPECGTPQSMERPCGFCGHKLRGGIKFCPECGTKVR